MWNSIFWFTNPPTGEGKAITGPNYPTLGTSPSLYSRPMEHHINFHFYPWEARGGVGKPKNWIPHNGYIHNHITGYIQNHMGVTYFTPYIQYWSMIIYIILHCHWLIKKWSKLFDTLDDVHGGHGVPPGIRGFYYLLSGAPVYLVAYK